MNLVRMLTRATGLAFVGGIMLLLFATMTTSPNPPTADAQTNCYYEQVVMPNGTIRWVKKCPNQMRAYPARRQIQVVQPVVLPYAPVNPPQPVQPELQDTQVIDTWEGNLSPVKTLPAAKPAASQPPTSDAKAAEKPAEAPAAPAATQAPASGGSTGTAKAAGGGSTGTVKASGGSTGTVKAASGGSTGSIKSGGSTGSQAAYGSYSAPVTYSYSSASYGSTGSQASYGAPVQATYTYSEPYYGTSWAAPSYAAAAAGCDCPDCNCVDCNCGPSASAYTYGAAPLVYTDAGTLPMAGNRVSRGFAGFFAGIRGTFARMRGCR